MKLPWSDTAAKTDPFCCQEPAEFAKTVKVLFRVTNYYIKTTTWINGLNACEQLIVLIFLISACL